MMVEIDVGGIDGLVLNWGLRSPWLAACTSCFAGVKADWSPTLVPGQNACLNDVQPLPLVTLMPNTRSPLDTARLDGFDQ